MLKHRDVPHKLGWAFATAVGVVKPTFRALTKCVWIDGEKIPAHGGCVLTPNHVSHIDPLTLGLFVYDHGRVVRYLAKEEIFDTPVIKHIAKGAKQIPVKRLTTDAASPFQAAVSAVQAGEAVTIYPEGTLTRDPNLWPMTGKTGAARVALTTGCPVIPIGQWGPEAVLPPYSHKPKLFPRKRIYIKAGDPVDLEDLRGKPLTNEVLHEATERIMAAITDIVASLRHEQPPAVRFDPRKAGVKQIGNSNKEKRAR